ncbi:MAG: hypothetical protein HQ478_14190 [Chloroflexi bacterium]|nr:hypothetical protein [Chloroflexota bacterium]
MGSNLTKRTIYLFDGLASYRVLISQPLQFFNSNAVSLRYENETVRRRRMHVIVANCAHDAEAGY